MKSQDHKIVIYLYNRLFDPLMQSNFWLYIRSVLDDRTLPYRLHLVTYEDPRYPLLADQEGLVRQWEGQGLTWTRLQWHPGTGAQAKLWDVAAGFAAVAKLRAQGYTHIVSLGSVAGGFAYLYARLLGMRLFLYQYEPHSEYAVDNRMWKEGGWQHRISRYLERRSAEFATVVASGTRFMEERLLKDWRIQGRFFKIATVADSQKFSFDQRLRDETRERLGIGDRPTLLYPGKFGDLYYRQEFAWMFRWLLDLQPDLYLLIVTPQDMRMVRDMMDAAAVPEDCYSIRQCDFSDIHKFYFAADMGIISVPPGPSKRFISNIKVGEYLCAGLPYLITEGVSEDYLHATEQDVGVVVRDFQESYVKGAWPEIRRFLTMEPEGRRRRCREFGLAYRGFDSLNPVFRQALTELTRC